MRFGGWECVVARGTAAATVAAAIVFGALGWWQLDRAAQKRALQETYRERATAAPLDLNAALAPCADGKGDWRRIVAQGRWQAAHQVLLDNAIVGGRVGYQVFTLLKLAGSPRGVLVNRGWVPAPAYRELAPAVDIADGDAIVHGIAAPVPFSGIGASLDVDASLGKGLLRVERIALPVLSGQLGVNLLSCIVRLDPQAPSGYVREWPAPGIDPGRHVAYAVQWFAFGAIAVGIYLFRHVRRIAPRD